MAIAMIMAAIIVLGLAAGAAHAQTPTVQFDPAGGMVFEAEEGDTVNLTVMLDSAQTGDLTVTYIIRGDGGADYSDPGGGGVTIAAGETAATVAVTIIDDVEIEPPRESFTLELTGGAGYRTASAFSTVSVVIKEGICDRGLAEFSRKILQVKILQEIFGSDDLGLCSAVTSELLASSVTNLVFDFASDIPGRDESRLRDLKRGDFSGLTGLTNLELVNQAFAEFPDGLFSDLSVLKRLRLHTIAARFAIEVPATLFHGLDSLEELIIQEHSLNQFDVLPSTVFDTLGDTLKTLGLTTNEIRSLPQGLFSALGKLTSLSLDGNNLNTLPDGIFEGLSGLGDEGSTLQLGQGFMQDRILSLPAALRLVSASHESYRFVVEMVHGAPFTMMIPLTVSGAAASPAPALPSSVTIAAGSTRSETFDVRRERRSALELTLGAPPDFDPPAVPTVGHDYRGFEIVFAEDAGSITIAVPLIVSVDVISTPESGVYAAGKSGEEIRVGVVFDQEVTVTRTAGGSTPTVTLEIGETTRVAVYDERESSTNRLVFRYALRGDDEDADGIVIVADTLNPHDAVVRSLGGLPADLSFARAEYPNLTVEPVIFELSFTGDFSAVLEGATATLVVAITPAPAGAFSAAYSIGTDADAATNDAAAGDYTDLGAGSVVIAADADAGTIRITITDDEQIEPPREFFVVTLRPPQAGANYAIGSTGAATVVIKEGVCDRTAEIRAALISGALTSGECSEVTSAELASLDSLDLSNRGLERLRAEDFSGLTGLTTLDLSGNRLAGLPVGALAGLTGLTGLRLEDNADTVTFTLTLQSVSTPSGSAFRVVIAEGAPFDVVVGLVTEPAGGLMVSSVTIPAGSTQSEVVNVPRGAGSLRVMVQAPGLPEDSCSGRRCYQGFRIVAGEPLVAGGVRLKLRVFLEGALE